MRGVLECSGQKWVQRREKNLSFHLYHHPRRPNKLGLLLEFTFVPSTVPEDAEEGQFTNVLYLDVYGDMPRTGNWRDLIGRRLAHQKQLFSEEGGLVREGEEGPTIELWSLGPGKGESHDHGKDFWSVSAEFGQPLNADGFELPVSVEAFLPSDDAREARVEKMHADVAAFLGGPEQFDAEREERLKDGWWLRYEGTVEFNKIFCHVPVNAADPVSWAKGLAKRELNLTEFGCCRVNGSRTMDEKFKPEDGVMETGRLVILNPLSDYWKDWLAQQKKG